MRTFRLTAGVVLLAVLALQGCSTNPTVAEADSIQGFAKGLSGKRYELVIRPPAWVPAASSGELVGPHRVPRGLMVALDPAQKLCVRDGGGELIFSDMLASGFGIPLPERIVCQRGTAPLWALFIRYADVKQLPYDYFKGNAMTMTLHPWAMSAEQYAVQLQEEQAKKQARAEELYKAAAPQRERQAALEQERQAAFEQRKAQAQQAALEKSVRVGTFQANLKAGDRFRWVRLKNLDIEGMVVRVEGAVVMVQLDRPTLSGQQTLYVPRSEIEPIN
jgi:hypothetical protein